MSLQHYQDAERIARTVASAIDRDDIGGATARLTDLGATDPLQVLRVVEVLTGKFSSDTRPARGESVVLARAIRAATNYGMRPYNEADADFNRALVNAVSGIFVRTLSHDDAARLDVAAGVMGGTRLTDQQLANQQKIVAGTTSMVLVSVIAPLCPQHRYDIADNLLNWGEQHKGSIPLYFGMQLEAVCDSAHRMLRQNDIDAVVAEATAQGKVRPAHSPRAQAAEAKAKAGS